MVKIYYNETGVIFMGILLLTSVPSLLLSIALATQPIPAFESKELNLLSSVNVIFLLIYNFVQSILLLKKHLLYHL